MTERKIGWAIIGCGRVVDRRVAPAIRRADGAELIGFCSRDLIRAGEFAGRHEARRAYGTIEEIFRDSDVEAVYIGTPNALHAAHAIACLEAGRNVLVEKPLALSAAEARRMSDTAQRAGRILSVMHQQRFHPANLHLLRLLDDGALGRPLIIRAQIGIWYPPNGNWRLDRAVSGGGATIDLAPHAVDIALEVGGPVARVSAVCANLNFKYGVEDFCQMRLEFARGAIGLIEMSYCTHAYGGRLEVYGSRGTFIADGSLQQAAFYRTALRHEGDNSATETVEDSYPHVFADAIEDFSDAIRDRRPPTVTIADAIDVMEIIDAAYESARTGTPMSPGAARLQIAGQES